MRVLHLLGQSWRRGTLGRTHPRHTKEVEWVHYVDVFGEGRGSSSNLFHIEPPYRESIVRMMVSRISHAARDRPTVLDGLPGGRPACPLPIG